MHKNKINGKVYIGQTGIDPKIRWGANGGGYTDDTYFVKSIRKYGWKNFEHIILETDLTLDDANVLEEYYIQKYKALDHNYGYNLKHGGSMGGHTEETKKKISIAHKGVPAKEETKRHLSEIQKGKHHSPRTEFKKGNIPWTKGKKLPQYMVEKIRERSKGNKYNFGHKWTEEQKKRQSERIKLTFTPERLKKMSDAMKGHIPWNKGKKMSDVMKGYIPWNKGKKMKIEQYEKRKETMFKKGMKPRVVMPVFCIELNKTFSSIKEAAKELNLKSSNICHCCKGRLHKTGGYHFKYALEGEVK